MNYCHTSHQLAVLADSLGLEDARAEAEQQHAMSLVPEMVSMLLMGGELEWGNKRIKGSYLRITADDIECHVDESGLGDKYKVALRTQDTLEAQHQYNKAMNKVAIEWIKQALVDYDYELPHQFNLDNAA